MIVSLDSGLLAAHATAAWHWMGFPAVSANAAGMYGHKLNLQANVVKPGFRFHRRDGWNQGGFQAAAVNWIQRVQPRQGHGVHGVALQVAFERQTLKPVFRLIGYRLWV
jgi:hypothetical protein